MNQYHATVSYVTGRGHNRLTTVAVKATDERMARSKAAGVFELRLAPEDEIQGMAIQLVVPSCWSNGEPVRGEVFGRV